MFGMLYSLKVGTCLRVVQPKDYKVGGTQDTTKGVESLCRPSIPIQYGIYHMLEVASSVHFAVLNFLSRTRMVDGAEASEEIPNHVVQS